MISIRNWMQRTSVAAILGFFALFLANSTPSTARQDNSILGYTVFGSGAEKVLVLHSWMSESSSFDPIKPYLDTDTYTFVFADVRGYGKSIKLTGEYTSQEASDDVFRLADKLGWKRFHLVGHSMNGMVAQRAALADWKSGKKRIKSIIATTPVAADGYPADEPTQKFLWSVIQNRQVTLQAFAALTGGRMHPAFINAMTNRHLATSNSAAMKGYYKMWLEEDFSKELAAAKVQIPFLVIGGRQDLPGFQEKNLRRTFGAWLPDVTFSFITDSGHFPMIETPPYYASIIQKFLKKNINAN